MKRKKNNSQETFSSQLASLWESCSKIYLTLVIVLSLLSAVGIYFGKLYFEGADINNFYSFLIWDNCIIHFALLSFFIWIILLNKKVFSPQNVSNRVSRFKQAFDRIISKGHSVQFYWLVSSFVLLFLFLSSLMGTIDSFGIFPRNKGLDWNPISLTYLLLTDTSTVSAVLKTNSHVANILAAICIGVSLLGTLLFTGLLVSVFSNFLQRRVEDFEKGRLHYDLSDHIVFIGYDEILPPLVKQCVEYEANRDRKILVQTKLPSEQVREDIKTLISDDALYRNIIFYNGRRDSVKDLMNLDLEKASEIYVVGNRKHDNHDELNLQCLGIIQEIINSKKDEIQSDKRIKVQLLIEDHTEYSKMRFLWDNDELLEVSLFNVYAIWAKALINGKYGYPLVKSEKNSQRKGINIIIFGKSKYGSSIGIEAINTFKRKSERTIITYICENAFDELSLFRARFTSLSNKIKCQYVNFKDTPIIYENINILRTSDNLNIEVEFIDTNPFDNSLYNYINKRDMCRYIFCCSENNTMDLNIALFMPQKIASDSTFYILQKNGTQFVNKLDYCSNLHTFGVLLSKFNIYLYLNEKQNDSHEKYDNYKETAFIFQNQGNWNKAIDYLGIALNMGEALYGKESLNYANDLIEMGFLYQFMGDYENALYIYFDALKIKEKKLTNNNLEIADIFDIIGWCNVYLADSHFGNDWYNYAAEYFGRSLEIKKNLLDNNHIEIANSYYNLYYAAEGQGLVSQALMYLEKYKEIYATLNVEMDKCTE